MKSIQAPTYRLVILLGIGESVTIDTNEATILESLHNRIKAYKRWDTDIRKLENREVQRCSSSDEYCKQKQTVGDGHNAQKRYGHDPAEEEDWPNRPNVFNNHELIILR